MHSIVKKFIEENILLIETGQFEKLFKLAYLANFSTAEMRQLHEVLISSNIVDSTQIRNDLLYQCIEENLKIARFQDPAIKNRYAVQFLRYYLNNTFGFTEPEAVDFMYQNQENFGIKLIRTDDKLFVNYRIVFD